MPVAMKPRLAFVSLWNADYPNAESGYAYSMRRQLQKRFDVVDLFPLALPGERFWLPLRAAYRLAGRYYHPMREKAVLKRLSRRIEHALRSIKPDVVFTPSSIPMSFVESRCAWMYAADQLFCDFVGTYIRNPSARFCRIGEAQEARALRAATRTTYPSDWAAQTAIGHYGADPSKVTVIPWGANLPEILTDDAVGAAILRRRPEDCRLVFIGRDWWRKGGDRFVAIVRELNRLGVKAHGIIIGADPPGLSARDFTVYPYLDKARADHFALFSGAMAGAHFLVAPVRAEAYGQALCEAAAFGVPAIACAVGGIPTIIRDGENGILLQADAEPREFAVGMCGLLESPERYRRMARAARDDYRERLNWDSFGARLCDTISTLV
jgi:glycosyltransferase involved in cell wall biosynthesis